MSDFYIIRAEDRDEEKLIKIINDVFNCDLKTNSRKKEYVYSRMIFSYILRLKGLTLSDIGGMLNKDHATIINYIKNMEWYLKSDIEFRQKYEVVKSRYEFNEKSPYLSNNKELYSSVQDLLNEINSLNLQLVNINKENISLKKSIKDKESNKPNLYRIIDERVRKGTEKEIEIKLNRFFNNVYD